MKVTTVSGEGASTMIHEQEASSSLSLGEDKQPIRFSLLYLRWHISSSEPHCRQFSVELPVRDDEKAGGAQPGRLLLDLPHQVGIQHCRPSDQKWYDMSYLSVECLNLISFKANLWVLGIGWLAALTSRKDGERRRRSVARDIFCLLLNHITCTMYMHFSTEGFS